ncbi:hypothetical protein F5Y12DRAFT_787947 [Xylaria sp. FL1777]|nr:hypothetical protein F5Y12DRAFT_787947 [Xylaria sp. FL1777]
MAISLPPSNLKRKTSRWQTLPRQGKAEDNSNIDVDDTRYSLMLFLRDLHASSTTWEEFIQALQNAPAITDADGPGSKFLKAALNVERINYDYINPDGSNKRRRLNLLGNSDAGTTMAEYDEIINLARTFWTNPDDLRDIMGELYQDNLGQQPGDQIYSLENIFHMARAWSEVRYRFMNHALRDDPNLGPSYNSGRQHTKGNSANAIIHESNILLDAKMVEFRAASNMGYAPVDRGIFQELYLLSPEEGRQLLAYSGPNTGLRVGLPQVFKFCVGFIDAVVNWRVQVLDASRKQVMASQAYRQATNQSAKAGVLDARHATNGARLANVDSPYASGLIPALRQLLVEASEQNAFAKATFDKLETAVNAIVAGVKGSPMNKAASNNHFTRMVSMFPGGITLTRPTGTALVRARPPPAPRSS